MFFLSTDCSKSDCKRRGVCRARARECKTSHENSARKSNYSDQCLEMKRHPCHLNDLTTSRIQYERGSTGKKALKREIKLFKLINFSQKLQLFKTVHFSCEKVSDRLDEYKKKKNEEPDGCPFHTECPSTVRLVTESATPR